MDVLSDVLKFLNFKKTVTRQAELTAPWGIRRGGCDKHNAFFFMVVRGGCYLKFDESPTLISLRAGDLIMSPKGAECSIMDAPGSEVTPIKEITEACGTHICKFGGGGHQTSLVMGYFELETLWNNPLMNALPTIVDLRADNLQNEFSLELVLRLLASETPLSKPGSEIFVSKLTHLLFVQVVRTYMSQIKQGTPHGGWFKALADKEIGDALGLIHQQPEAPWTVAGLAEAVGLSRTSFATKFATLVQSPPVDYLTTWRMQKAQHLLYDESLKLDAIASAVGYQSEAAFCKAFKRETGRSPGVFRKEVSRNQQVSPMFG